MVTVDHQYLLDARRRACAPPPPVTIFDFKDHVEKAQAYAAASSVKNWPMPSARGLMICIGYDVAKASGLLEPYKDALGANFGRPDTAWDEKWASVYPNSEHYKAGK